MPINFSFLDFIQAQMPNYYDELKIEPFIQVGKSGIKIKKKNRGKFTEYCGGTVTSECIARGKNSSDPAVRKRATFAANARAWKHQYGGTAQTRDVQQFLSQYKAGFDQPTQQTQRPVMEYSNDDDIVAPTFDNYKPESQEPASTSNEGFKLSDLTYGNSPSIMSTTPTTSVPSVTPSYRGTKVNIGDNEREAAKYFSSLFNSKGVVAGILGTIKGESNWNHQAINKAEKAKGYRGYGRGIAQWSNERVDNFAKHMGKSIEDSSLQEQLQYLNHEMSQRSALTQELRRIDSSNMSDQQKARATVDVMIRGFLNGGNNSLASVDQMNQTYKRAWAKLPNYGTYDYTTSSLNKRDKYAQHYLLSI